MKIFLLYIFILNSLQNECPNNCNVCGNKGSCIECKIGYTIDLRMNIGINTFCYPCPQGCATCTYSHYYYWLNTYCHTCFEGYIFSGDKCLKCNPECKSCSITNDNCVECSQGYQLVPFINKNGNTCKLISKCYNLQHCIICQNKYNKQICIKCQNGYYNFGGSCVKCTSPCSLCEIDYESLWNNEVMNFWKQTLRLLQAKINKISLVKSNNILPENLRQQAIQPQVNIKLQNNQIWIIQDWKSSNWASYTFLAYNSSNFIEIKGWVEAYIFFTKTYDQKQNATLIDYIYYCLPIIKQLLQLTNDNNLLQWNNLARFISKYTTKIWKGYILYENIILLQSFTLIKCINCLSGYKSTYILPQNNTQYIHICVQCPQNCLSCYIDYNTINKITLCQKCKQGYYFNYNTYQCQKCDINCTQCNIISTNCTKCQQQYKLNILGQCMICPIDCQTCRQDQQTGWHLCVTCIQRYSYYAASKGYCYSCIDSSCRVCDEINTKICYECKVNYTLIQNTCIICPINCQSCYKDNCIKCKQNYILNYSQNTNKQKQCIYACQQYCIKCQQANPKICIQCDKYKYYDKYTLSCKQCQIGCIKCINNKQCIEYQNGITIYNGNIIKCNIGCKVCSKYNPQICLQCYNKYYLQYSINNIMQNISKCIQCQQNCQKCYNQTICLICNNKYTLSKYNNKCIKCAQNCKTCSQGNPQHCLSCYDKYQLQINSNGICVQYCNITNCIKCNYYNNKCIICQDGYTVTYNGKCNKCGQKCIGSCFTDINICYDCPFGYKLIKYNNQYKCIQYPQGCEIQTQYRSKNNICQKCLDGYRYNITTLLCDKLCLYPCLTCINTTICVTCIQGYVLNTNGICIFDISCNPNCSICLQGSILAQNYIDCILCPLHCSQCNNNNNSICNVCFDGYYLNTFNSQCEKCSIQCQICYNEKQCKTCAQGYVKQIRQIYPFIIFGDICIKCHQNCKKCYKFSNLCKQCKQGYHLKYQKCIGIYTVNFEYQIDEDYNNFNSNGTLTQFHYDLSEILSIDSSNIMITNIKQGSVIIIGYISSNNQTHANSINIQLMSLSLTNYNVTSFKSYVYMFQPQTPNNDNNTNYVIIQKLSKNAIIGIVIGCVVFGISIFIIIGFIIYKLYFVKKEINAQIIYKPTQQTLQNKLTQINNEKINEKQEIENNIQAQIQNERTINLMLNEVQNPPTITQLKQNNEK